MRKPHLVKITRRSSAKNDWADPTGDSKRQPETNLEEAISKCLEAVDFDDELENMDFDRCPGTASWVLNDPNFLALVSSSKPACLFLSGSPGSGKTFLLSSITTHLQDLQNGSDDDSLAYFFCDNKVEGLSKRSALAVLKTFLAQLLSKLRTNNPEFVQATLEALTSSKQKAQNIPLRQFHTIFARIIKLFKATYLVLDALDECDDWRQVLEILSRLLQDGSGRVKLIISSRNTSGIPHAVSKMSSGARFDITVGPDTTKQDIQKFIDWRIDSALDVRDLGTDESARNTLVEGSQGLFLLARLRFNALQQQIITYQTDLKSAVRELPKEIHIYYERALERLEGEDLQTARQIFFWVMFAQVPLTVEELIEATALREDRRSRGEAKRLTLLGIEHLGAGLTVVVGGKVQLAHATVKDFAAAYRWNGSDPQQLFSQNHTIHSDISTTCVAYLTIPQLVSQSSASSGSYESAEKQWPFLRYSSNYWLTHLFFSTPSDTRLTTTILNFLKSESGLTWWRYYISQLSHNDWWSIPVLASQFTAWAHHNDVSSLSLPSNYRFILDLCKRHMSRLEATIEIGDSSEEFNACMRLSEQMFNIGSIDEAERLLNKAIDTNKRAGRDVSSETLSAMSDLCVSYSDRGLFDKAETLARKLQTICEQSYPRDHRDHIHALNIVSGIKYLQSYYHEAENIQTENLLAARRSLGNEDPTTLVTRNALALTYIELYKIGEAEELLTEVSYAAILGNEHPSTLTGMENIASIYGLRGQLLEEVALREEVSAKRKINQGSKSIDSTVTIVHLATAYLKKGDVKHAKAILTDLLQSTREWLSIDHPIILQIEAEYATTLRMEGCLEEAIRLQQHVLGQRKCLLGHEHPWTLQAMVELAFSFQDQEDLQQAEQMQNEVLAKRILRFGEDHVDVLDSTGYVANLLESEGKLEDAEKLEEGALSLLSRRLCEGNPAVLQSKSRLSSIKQAMGKLKVAEGMGEDILRCWTRISGPDSDPVLNAKARLADTKVALLKEDDGKKLQKQVVDGRKKLSGGSSPDFLRSLASLAVTSRRMGELVEAERLGEQVLDGWRKLAGNNSPFTLNAMSSLAITLNESGKFDRSKILQDQVLEGRKAIGGGDTCYFFAALENLALTLQQTGHLKRAKEMQEQALEGRKNLGKGNSDDILTAMANLAITTRKLGNITEAESMEEHVLKTRKAMEDDSGSDVLCAMANLAVTKQDLGKLNEAAELQEEVLFARRKHALECSRKLFSVPKIVPTKRVMVQNHETPDMEERVLVVEGEEKLEGGLALPRAVADRAETKWQSGQFEETGGLEEKLQNVPNCTHIGHRNALWNAMTDFAVTKLKSGDREGAERLLEEVSAEKAAILGEDSLNYIATIESLVNTKIGLGKYGEAEDIDRKVLETRKRILGNDNLLVWQSMHSLATTLLWRGKLDEARKLAQDAIDGETILLGSESSIVLESMASLALILRSMMKWEEALTLQRTVYDVRKTSLGEHSTRTLESLGRVGRTLFSLNRSSEAEPLQEFVLQEFQKCYPPEHEHVLEAMQNLGAVKNDVGKEYEGEILLRNVLQIRLRLFGESHRGVREAMFFLARSKIAQNQLEEAETLDQSVLDLYTQYTEETSPDYWKVVENLAATKEDLWKFGEAQELFESSLRIKEMHTPEDSISRLDTLEHLSNILRKQSKFIEAADIQHQVVTKRRDISTTTDADLLKSLSALSLILLEKGALDEAEELQRSVFTEYKASLGEDNEKTLKAMEALILVKKKNKKLDQAEDLAKSLLEQRKTGRETSIDSLVTAMDALASILVDQGRKSDGMELEKEAYKLSCEKYGVDGPETREILIRIAIIKRDCDPVDEELLLYEERCLKISESIYSITHPLTVRDMWNVATTKLHFIEKHEEALAMFRRMMEICTENTNPDNPSISELQEVIDIWGT
jgi:tetratricopeptide (TPR) repeat protein